MLLAETGAHDAVRFRHDRIREAVLAKLDTQQRRSLQLALARRLAATPELVAVAAQQYLPVIEAITDAAERSHVLALLRRAAEQASISVPVSRASATRSAPVQTGRTRRTESVERQQTQRPTWIWRNNFFNDLGPATSPSSHQRNNYHCLGHNTMRSRA